jgi:hypothetical protein
VRARANGTVAYLKEAIATQLSLSPRLALTLMPAGKDAPLPNDSIIAP